MNNFILIKVNCDLINIYLRNCDVMFFDSNVKFIEMYDIIQYCDIGCFFFGFFFVCEIDFFICEIGFYNL